MVKIIKSNEEGCRDEGLRKIVACSQSYIYLAVPSCIWHGTSFLITEYNRDGVAEDCNYSQ